jgi:hypothetical protein
MRLPTESHPGIYGLKVAPPRQRENRDVICETALSLRAKYRAALEAEEASMREAARPPKGADGITLVELRQKKQAAARELLEARRRYWEHLEEHGCARR